MPRVPDTFKIVIAQMTHGTDFKLVNMLHTENANLTYKELNTTIEAPEYQWIIHLVSYGTLTPRAKPSINSQLSYCAWSFGIFDKSHRYKTKNSVGSQIGMNAKIGFKLQVTATPGFHSLYDWCFQMMWLFQKAHDDPEDDTVMTKDCAGALYYDVKSWMHAIWTNYDEAQQDVAHRVIQIAEPWMIGMWLESKIANRKSLFPLHEENAHLIGLEWTEDKQANVMTLVERYSLRGFSGAWRVDKWRLACC